MAASSKGIDRSDADYEHEVDQLTRAFAAVDDLIASIRPEQWSALTPLQRMDGAPAGCSSDRDEPGVCRPAQ